MPISDVGLQVPPRHSPGSAKGENSVLLRFSYTAIGLSAFLLTCLGLRAVLPFPEIDEVTQKLRFFAAHKDDFDTIFIGSSRIYHQISPTVFDQVMRENEIPTRTFNFGVDGMHLPESAYVLERVLATRPRILKYVFIELGELQTKWPHEIEGSRRALYWHDWRRTSLVLRKILGAGTHLLWLPNLKKIRDIILPRKGGLETRDLVVFHTAQFEKNFTNIGRASDLSACLSQLYKKEPGRTQPGPGGDGYLPVSRVMSAEQTATYERALALALSQARSKSVSPHTEKVCLQCSKEIRSFGAMPVFLVTPTTTQSKLGFSGNFGSPGTVISFNDARLYPNFYRKGVRVDQEHMDGVGAEEFTQLLAEKFAQLIWEGRIK